MPNISPLDPLLQAYAEFVRCIESLPEARFLTPLDGWSPRDVLAHLIDWNRLMIEASASILMGKAPAYYADAPNDYRNINAGFVANYSSTSKVDLLLELEGSLGEFKAYVAGLPLAELSADHGVIHHSGRPATIAAIILSLAGDYRHHLRQIRDWLAGG